MVQTHTQQRTGSSHMILWGIFAEILKGCQASRYNLYFIKNNKRVCGNGGTCINLERLNDTVHVEILVKEDLQLCGILEIYVYALLIILAAKLAQEPSLAYLTRSAHDEWLASGTVLPCK